MKKVHLIFDLSKTLLCAASRQNYQLTARPDFSDDRYHYFLRPHREPLFGYLFKSTLFQVGVWSSLDASLTKFITPKIFGLHQHRLSIITATSRDDGDPQRTEPIALYRNLAKLSQHVKELTVNNTFVVSTLANKIKEYDKNDLVLTPFNVETKSQSQDHQLKVLFKFLEGVEHQLKRTGVEDVRPFAASGTLHNLGVRFNRGLRPEVYD